MELRNLRRPEIRSARVRGNEERNKIEHVEIETGTNKECEVIAPGKKEHQVREDAAGKDKHFDPAGFLTGHKINPVGLCCGKFPCDELAERDIGWMCPPIGRYFLISWQMNTCNTGDRKPGLRFLLFIPAYRFTAVQ